MDLIKTIWGWLTGAALHQLAVIIVLLFAAFCLLLKFPVEFDRIKYISKDFIDVTESTHYILHTELNDSGAKVQLETKTYYVEVKKSE